MADFESFRKEFKGDIVTPADAGYVEAIERWAHNAVRRAAIVAFVKDPQDVVTALKYARAAKLPLAIRGGGHSASGASSSEGGLVIDLSRYINGATVDAEKKLAYVGGGAVWKTVDLAAIKHGLATVGGTVNHTGVGGLIVGGGYGWLSSQYGLAIDNLATVVVADGRILTASDTENSDLFWGIRGGGSNFGVVTEFVLKLYPQRSTVYFGPLIFPPPMIPQIGVALDDWWNATKAGVGESVLGMLTRAPDGNPVAVVSLFYNGTAEEGRKHFKAFFDLKPIADLSKEIPFEELNAATNHMAIPGLNYYMTGTPLSSKLSNDFTIEHLEKTVALSEKGGIETAILFEWWPNRQINSVAPDATPYRRNLNANSLIIVTWKEESQELAERAKQAAASIKSFMPEGQGYGNYNITLQDEGPQQSGPTAGKAHGLFGEYYPRLQAVKKEYDPDVIFNKWFPITPA
ncbi:hypothetical protein NLI96_g9951 [Meripilus lineatus]|uniref:FAD-binding PCMH-type domain-containing protein n=1 Tax=Meripilus lineatus TaxID=2056292 RepID=A0AAD5UW89_9APHY|nr:hypothetical protein NLI96_g9951 [Physisporinus lineatus]